MSPPDPPSPGGVGSPAVGARDLLYSLYERRLSRHLRGVGERPRHVAVMLDGNRRWAREAGFVDVNDGHRVGAAKIADLLAWCEEEGVQVVTLFLLSTDNLTRPADELDPLLRDHRGRRRRARGPDGAVAGADRRRAGPAARRHRAPARRGGRAHGRAAAARAERGRRLRRPPGDRRRGAQAAAAPRRGGHVDRGTRRGARRRPHRRASLHLRPARSRPRDPHVGGAAAVGLPAVAVGATRSSGSARPTGPRSARWTSSARCATTPPDTAASVPNAASRKVATKLDGPDARMRRCRPVRVRPVRGSGGAVLADAWIRRFPRRPSLTAALGANLRAATTGEGGGTAPATARARTPEGVRARFTRRFTASPNYGDSEVVVVEVVVDARVEHVLDVVAAQDRSLDVGVDRDRDRGGQAERAQQRSGDAVRGLGDGVGGLLLGEVALRGVVVAVRQREGSGREDCGSRASDDDCSLLEHSLS